MKFRCLLVSRTNNESPCGIVFGFNVTSYALTRTVLQLACMSDQPTHPFQTTKYYGSHAFFFSFLSMHMHTVMVPLRPHDICTQPTLSNLWVSDFVFVVFRLWFCGRACLHTINSSFVLRSQQKKINVFWFECSVVEGQWTGWMKVKLGKVVLKDAEIQASGSMWYLIG